MNWLNKLERKFGRYAISGLTRYMILSYVIGYLFSLTGMINGGSGLLGLINLNPYLIFHGQVWRLVTWVLMPPGTLSIFTVIMLFFYYSLGTALEQTWGTFRYNVYIFSGLLITLVGTILVYFIGPALGLRYTAIAPEWGSLLASAVSTYYVNMSIFFAFAANYPDMRVMLYFIIPVKIKWLAIFDAVLMLFSIITSPWFIKVIILLSLLNFVIFFLSTRNFKRVSPQEIHRKWEFKRNVNNAKRSGMKYNSDGKITKHKCAVCGRTELDSPNLEFRFCSRCNGNYEYCQDHLFTHKHIS